MRMNRGRPFHVQLVLSFSARDPILSEGIFVEALAILPGKHFFRDDVGLLAYASGEEFGGLKNGRADFLEVVGAEHVADGGFDEVPERRVGREKVAGSSGGFDSRSLVAGHWSFGSSLFAVRRSPGPWRDAFHPGVSVGLDWFNVELGFLRIWT